jgi:hypothetical protein
MSPPLILHTALLKQFHTQKVIILSISAKKFLTGLNVSYVYLQGKSSVL